jgi:SAM-dependent methyltransferase
MVLAAQARLARQGGWERILAGEPLEGTDALDAELLSAAGVLRQEGELFTLADPDYHHHDPAALASGNIAYLRRALRYAQRGGVGWAGDDPVVVRQQGRASAVAADMIAEQLPAMPGPDAAYRSGGGRFLDVGVGVGAISLRLCELFPGSTAVGLDVLPEVLDVARKEVADRGCEGRVELRLLDVVDLADEEAFDLAWVPQPFLPPASLEEGLARVHAALKPEGWLVMPLNAPVGECDFQRALADHSSYLLGGGPMKQDEAETVVASAGYEDLTWQDYHGLSLLLARRPEVATVTRLTRKVSGADRTHGGHRLGEEHGVGDPAGARSVGDRC